MLWKYPGAFFFTFQMTFLFGAPVLEASQNLKINDSPEVKYSIEQCGYSVSKNTEVYSYKSKSSYLNISWIKNKDSCVGNLCPMLFHNSIENICYFSVVTLRNLKIFSYRVPNKFGSSDNSKLLNEKARIYIDIDRNVSIDVFLSNPPTVIWSGESNGK